MKLETKEERAAENFYQIISYSKFKGQILNQIANKMLKETSDIVPNWLISIPDENVSVGIKCDPFKVEMVIRGYLSGHAARKYKRGDREICGVSVSYTHLTLPTKA